MKVVEGGKGRSNTDPRLLAALWIYGYSEGINSAPEQTVVDGGYIKNANIEDAAESEE